MVKPEGNPLKELLGELPFSAELFWLFRNREKPLNSRFSLKNFQQHLPEIITRGKEQYQGKPNWKAGAPICLLALLDRRDRFTGVDHGWSWISPASCLPAIF